jgi:hypothetical protein
MVTGQEKALGSSSVRVYLFCGDLFVVQALPRHGTLPRRVLPEETEAVVMTLGLIG